MMLKWCKDEKRCCFVAGAAAAVAGMIALKSNAARKACVTAIAQGMKLQKDAQVLFETMKEDAQDLCYEAELKNAQPKEAQ